MRFIEKIDLFFINYVNFYIISANSGSFSLKSLLDVKVLDINGSTVLNKKTPAGSEHDFH
jgi:hypothetical protein